MTVHRAFLEWLERDFFIPTGHGWRFSADAERQVGGIVFAIPLTEG